MAAAREQEGPVLVVVQLSRDELLCRFLDDPHLLAVGIPDPRPQPPPRRPKDTRWQLRLALDGSFEVWSLDPKRTHAPHRGALRLIPHPQGCTLELQPLRDRARGERLEGALGVFLLLAWPIIDPFDFFASLAIGVGRVFVRVGRVFGVAPQSAALPSAQSSSEISTSSQASPSAPATDAANDIAASRSLSARAVDDGGPWRDSLMSLLGRAVGGHVAPQEGPSVAPFRALPNERRRT